MRKIQISYLWAMFGIHSPTVELKSSVIGAPFPKKKSSLTFLPSFRIKMICVLKEVEVKIQTKTNETT